MTDQRASDPNRGQALSQVVASSSWGTDAGGDSLAAAYLEEQAEDPFLRQVARQSLAQMHLTPGMRVLDVGCGTGVLLPAFAHAVGPDGRVVGLDHNPAFLDEARQRLETAGVGRQVELLDGDALALPFPDASFGAAHCERVLMHLADPGRAIRELARVVGPGGWVVIAEPDYGGIRYDHPDQDTMRVITAAILRRFASPGVGLESFRLMGEAGLTARSLEVLVEVETDLHPMSLAAVEQGAESAVADGTLDSQRVEAAIAYLRDAAGAGEYASYDHFCIAAGQVPTA